jgi:hypothetical protein
MVYVEQSNSLPPLVLATLLVPQKDHCWVEGSKKKKQFENRIICWLNLHKFELLMKKSSSKLFLYGNQPRKGEGWASLARGRGEPASQGGVVSQPRKGEGWLEPASQGRGVSQPRKGEGWASLARGRDEQASEGGGMSQSRKGEGWASLLRGRGEPVSQ